MSLTYMYIIKQKSNSLNHLSAPLISISRTFTSLITEKGSKWLAANIFVFRFSKRPFNQMSKRAVWRIAKIVTCIKRNINKLFTLRTIVNSAFLICVIEKLMKHSLIIVKVLVKKHWTISCIQLTRGLNEPILYWFLYSLGNQYIVRTFK